MNSGWKYVGKQFSIVLIVVLLACLFLAIGLMLGYGVIGEGDNPLSILSIDKWESIISKFTGK